MGPTFLGYHLQSLHKQGSWGHESEAEMQPSILVQHSGFFTRRLKAAKHGAQGLWDGGAQSVLQLSPLKWPCLVAPGSMAQPSPVGEGITPVLLWFLSLPGREVPSALPHTVWFQVPPPQPG